MIKFKDILNESAENFNPKVNEADRKWLKFLNEKGWTKNYRYPDERCEKLKQILLSFGGICVVMVDTEKYNYDLKQYLSNRSGLIKNKGILLTRGASNRCHSNSARIWEMNKNKYVIQTGFALSDIRWIEHSWLFEIRTNKIIETTPVKRELYFGYSLDEKESEKFAIGNDDTLD